MTLLSDDFVGSGVVTQTCFATEKLFGVVNSP